MAASRAVSRGPVSPSFPDHNDDTHRLCSLQAPQDSSPMGSWIFVAWSRFFPIRVSVLYLLPKDCNGHLGL